jgi:hypothetical protein
LVVVGIGLTSATLLAQSTIREIQLAEGLDEANRLAGPVYDAEGLQPMAEATLTASYDRRALLVRRGGGNIFTRGPEYRLDPKVDMAVVLNDAINIQAAAMGFRTPRSGEKAWRVGGTVRDVYLESRQVPYGATLFYGYLDVTLEVDDPDGAHATVPMRVHTYYGAYNAGLGRRDEAQAAAANLLVHGAQEMIARLARQRMKPRPHPSIEDKLETIRTGDLSDQLGLLRAISLSGAEAATPTLLALLPGVDSEGVRSAVIDALAVLGSAESVDLLATRYATEDEDCRWYTLKAMDYVGTDEAMRVVTASGLSDGDNGPRRLAHRILGRKP